jgi:hypothetical protein
MKYFCMTGQTTFWKEIPCTHKTNRLDFTALLPGFYLGMHLLFAVFLIFSHSAKVDPHCTRYKTGLVGGIQMVDTFLTKKIFKDFFQKNVAML